MEEAKSRNKKVIWLVVAGLLIVAVSMGAYIISGLDRVSTNDAYIEGRIHSIASKIPGAIKAVCVADNQTVKKGDLLVEIDATDYELAANLAQANLEIQQVAFDQASRDKVRVEALYNDKVLSQDRYEKALTAYNLSNAQLKAAGEQLKIARRHLEHTRILSPADGYVTKKSAVLGNQVMPAQPLMAVVDLNDIWLVANYKETQLTYVRPGQSVDVDVDCYPGRVFTGRVDSIMAGTGAAFSLFPPENALGNYVKVVQRVPVKIVFDRTADSRDVLRLGMSCVAVITTAKGE